MAIDTSKVKVKYVDANRKTHTISLKSALSYDHEHRAYKAALYWLKNKSRPKQSGIKTGSEKNKTQNVTYKGREYQPVATSWNNYRKQSQDLIAKSSKSIQTSIDFYLTDMGGSLVNRVLRGDKLDRGDQKTRSAAKRIAKILQTQLPVVPLAQNAVLFRGINPRDKAMVNKIIQRALLTKQKGQHLIDRGLTSTTATKSIAAMFTGDDEYNGLVLQILAPKGTNVLAVSAKYDTPERELILPPGTKFEVIEFRESQPFTGAKQHQMYSNYPSKQYRDVLTLRVVNK